MTLYIATAFVLAAAAAFDGWTTVRFVRLGYEEGGTRWLLGAKPTPLVVYGRGGAAIAAELFAALLLVRHARVVGQTACLLLLAQASLHVYCGAKNARLK